MKRILHLVSVKNITFKKGCLPIAKLELIGWEKYDAGLSLVDISISIQIGSNIAILRRPRPLTANYLAMFKVISTIIYT